MVLRRLIAPCGGRYTFNLLDYLRRHMHTALPKEYKDDPRMHPYLQVRPPPQASPFAAPAPRAPRPYTPTPLSRQRTTRLSSQSALA